MVERQCGQNQSCESIAELLEHFDDSYSPLVKLAKTSGFDAVRVLLEEAGGTKPHLPTLENFEAILRREVRNEEIRAEFNGRNYDQLEMKFGVKQRQLRQILHSKARHYQRHSEPEKTVKISDENYEALTLMAADYNSNIRAVTDVVLQVARKHPDVHAALREACGGEQMRMDMEEAA